MLDSQKRRIGTLLVEAGLISEGQLKDGLEVQKKQGGKIVGILIGLGYLTPAEFTSFLGTEFKLAGVDIGRYGVSEDLLALIPREFVLEHEVFPIDKLGKLLTVGMVCPLDSDTVQELEDLTGLRVKPLLCSVADLRESIERYYKRPSDEESETLWGTSAGSAERLEAPLKLAGVAALVRKLESLPVLPQTVRRLRDTMGDVDVSVSDVAKIISTDPPIAARMLQVANSAAFGFPNRVTTVSLAVALLGLRDTYSIVLSLALVDLMKASKSFDYKSYWTQSMMCGGLAMLIAKLCRLDVNRGFFAAGLLQDIGRVALAEVAPERYAKIDSSLTGAKLIEAEEEVLGIAHPEAGYILTSEWGLPGEIVEAIRFQHTLERTPEAKEMTAVVALTERFVSAQSEQRANQEWLCQECASILQTLRIDNETAVKLFGEMEELLKSKALLDAKWDTQNPET